MKRTWRGYLLMFLALWMGACAISKNPVSGRKRLFAYSWKEEIRIGRKADAEIARQYGLYRDAELEAYVREVGERVLAQSHLRRPEADPEFRQTPFTFRVLDSPVVNAFALPGGFVYVTRGLLAHLNNEAQLAVVLGHEIAHVAARHTSQRMMEIQLGQLGLLGGAILGEEVLGLPARDILELGSTAVQLLLLKYSRDDEREADRLGVEYAALAGYQVAEAAAFFRTLDRLSALQGGGDLPTFLSTHPDPGEREQTILELARTWAARARLERVERERYLARLEGLVFGEDPRRGFVREGYFYHPEQAYFFPIPLGWSLQREGPSVLLIEPNERALMELRPVEASTPEAAARALIAQGITPLTERAVRVSGLPAYRLEGEVAQEGKVYRLLAYFIAYNGRVYRFTGITTASLYPNMVPYFLSSMTHFAPLRDPTILSVAPHRIYIARAPRTAPFRSLLPDDIPREISLEVLAILNQVEVHEVIPEGTPLKWVR